MGGFPLLTISNQPGMTAPQFYQGVSHDEKGPFENQDGEIYRCNGNRRGMRQDELDLIEALTTSPVFDSAGPAMACVTEAMSKDDGSGVSAGCREDEGIGFAVDGRGHGGWFVLVGIEVGIRFRTRMRVVRCAVEANLMRI